MAAGANRDVTADKQSQQDPSAGSLKRKASKHTVITQFTIRKPQWSYIRLKLVTSASLGPHGGKRSEGSTDNVDEVTCYMHIQSALRQFLGLYGTAIQFDILGVVGHDITIRVARQDAEAVVAALGGWVGSSGEAWRILSWGCWGPKDSDGLDLFDDS